MIRESGVSNVVGVILLLFLVMVTSAVLGLVLSSATYDAVDTTPDVIFTVSENQFLLYHGGGDILYKNDLVFYAGGDDVSGSIFLEGEGDSWSNIWTDWHTGQAIKISDGRHSASDLAIVALDSRGNAYLVYNGPTADPIPSGKPVPDVTPVPTPSPVRPDASFTLTSVDPGLNVSMSGLPPSLTTTTDWIVVMKEKVVGGHWEKYHGKWIWVEDVEIYAEVEFTAIETGDVTYAWESTGTVGTNTSRSVNVTFDSHGDYTVTLTVTNSSGSSSSMKNISVRNPGLTVMTWIQRDGWGNWFGYPYFRAYNSSGWGIFEQYKWQLDVEPTNNYYDNYDLKFSIGYYDDYVTDTKEYLNNGVWYHVVGTYEQSEPDNFLNIYLNGWSEKSKTTSETLNNLDLGTTPYPSKYDFEYDASTFYEIPFAMTAADIHNVYDAENLDGHP